MKDRNGIFISHISEERPFAIVLKKWIESTFLGQYKVFLSTDIESIPAGAKWLSAIDHALSNSGIIVLLCSPVSITRPWVNFEAGCGWAREVPVIPLCHAGQKIRTLPSPLAGFQALELDDPAFSEKLFNSMARHLHVRQVPRLQSDLMIQELNEAEKEVATLMAASQQEVTDQSEESIRARLVAGIVGFFRSQSDTFIGQPSTVFGEAKDIVRRFDSESDVHEKIRSEIETRKKTDANWTYANLLREALALVNALGLSRDTRRENRVFMLTNMPPLAKRTQARKRRTASQ